MAVARRMQMGATKAAPIPASAGCVQRQGPGNAQAIAGVAAHDTVKGLPEQRSTQVFLYLL